MESFIHRNKVIKFWSVTGVILGQNKYSETHVSSSGGGGYIGKQGGYVSAPKIHSHTVTNHEFWIKKEDGSEKNVRLTDYNIPLREDQIITLIYAGLKDTDSGYLTTLVNHSAKKHWHIRKSIFLNKHLKIDQASGGSILIAGGLWWLVAHLTNSVDAGAIIAILFIVYRLPTKIYRILKMTQDLDKHLESLAKKAHQINET